MSRVKNKTWNWILFFFHFWTKSYLKWTFLFWKISKNCPAQLLQFQFSQVFLKFKLPNHLKCTEDWIWKCVSFSVLDTLSVTFRPQSIFSVIFDAIITFQAKSFPINNSEHFKLRTKKLGIRDLACLSTHILKSFSPSYVVQTIFTINKEASLIWIQRPCLWASHKGCTKGDRSEESRPGERTDRHMAAEKRNSGKDTATGGEWQSRIEASKYRWGRWQWSLNAPDPFQREIKSSKQERIRR